MTKQPEVESHQALTKKIDELQKENEQLKKSVRPAAANPSRWRAVVSALLIIVATVFVPAAIMSSWTRTELVNENRFVNTFAPLAKDPAIQTAVTDQIVQVINDQVDLNEATNSLFDGIESLGLDSKAVAALNLLRAPAEQGVNSLINSAVSAFVTSDAFYDVWKETLRYTHKAFSATVSTTGDSGLTVDGNGTVTIQLKPILEDIKTILVDKGFSFASNIPSVDTGIVVGQSTELATISVAYTLTNSIGWWLPFIVMIVFGLGILVARDRLVAITGTGIGIAIGAAVILVTIVVGKPLLTIQTTGTDLPVDALVAAYSLITAQIAKLSWVLVLLGGFAALFAASQGTSGWATSLRSKMSSFNAGVHSNLVEKNMSGGKFSNWLGRFHVLLSAVIAILVLAALYLLPTTFLTLLLVVILGLFLWWLLLIFEDVPATKLSKKEKTT